MNLNFFNRTLQPGETVSIAVRGRLVRGIAADARYQIRLDQGQYTDFETGIAFESPSFFERLEIRNSHTVVQTIRVAVADGYVDDNRLVGQVDISGGIRLAGNRAASYGTVTVGTAAVQIVAADNNRGTVLVQNLGAAAVYVGTDSAVTVANGLQIGAGGSAEFTLQTALWGISGAAGQDVRYLSEAL